MAKNVPNFFIIEFCIFLSTPRSPYAHTYLILYLNKRKVGDLYALHDKFLTTLLPLPNNFFFKFGIISFLRRFVKERLQKRLLKIFSRKERYEKGKNNLWFADL